MQLHFCWVATNQIFKKVGIARLFLFGGMHYIGGHCSLSLYKMGLRFYGMQAKGPLSYFLQEDQMDRICADVRKIHPGRGHKDDRSVFL